MVFQTDALLPTPGHRRVIHPQNLFSSWLPSWVAEVDSEADSCFTMSQSPLDNHDLNSKLFRAGFELVFWKTPYFPTDRCISLSLLTAGHKMNFNIPDLHRTTSNLKGKYIKCFTSTNYPWKYVFLLKLTCQLIIKYCEEGTFKKWNFGYYMKNAFLK